MANFLDSNGVTYLWSKIKAKITASIENKVDKVAGKGLSSNDYTTTEKNKLAGVETGANKYVHPSHTAKSSGLYKTTVDALGHVSAVSPVTKEDITELGIPSQDTNTTYDIFSVVKSGLVPVAPKIPSFLAQGGWATMEFGHTPHAEDITYELDCIAESYRGILAGFSIPAATNDNAGLMTGAHRKKLEELPTNEDLSSTYALKSDIVNMYKYKGSVASAGNLPTTGQKTGDVYNIESASIYGGAGANVAWNGSAWDSLGEIFTVTAITNAQLDSICV